MAQSAAEKLFYQVVRDAAALSKRRQKHKMRWPEREKACLIREFKGAGLTLEKQDLEQKLSEMGVKSLSINTLRNWERWGLIPCSLGKSGRKKIFPTEALYEAYASYCMLRGTGTGIKLTADQVAAVRAAALRVEKDPALLKKFIMPADVWIEDDDGDVLAVDAVYYKTPSGLGIPGGGEYMAAWLSRRAEAEAGILTPGQVQTVYSMGQVQTVYSILGGEVKKELRITDQGGLRIV